MMEISICSTDEIVQIDGRNCRVWKGVTSAGVECVVFVARVGVIAGNCEAFEDHLLEQPQPIEVRVLEIMKEHLGEVSPC